jgi:hypothetical protein
MAATNNPLANNAFRIGGMPSLTQLNQMGGGFSRPPVGFQFGRTPTQPLRSIGPGMFDSNTRRQLMGRFDPMAMLDGEEDEDPTQQQPRGKMGKIKNFLTGSGGQALASGANAIAGVIGSSMERKTERERTQLSREQFELQKQREEERLKRANEIRALLMAEYDKFRPR